MKKSVLATSVALSLLVIVSGGAQAADGDSLADLQAQLKVLKQQVDALEQQKQNDAKAALTSARSTNNVADGVAEDTTIQPATQSELAGFRTDLENYKYDDARQYERQTTKSTRDTTIYGTVQLLGQAQSRPTTSGNPAPNAPRYSTFNVPTALIGVRGNLFKDYKEGKNLDYQLSFSYAQRPTATGSAADLNLADAFIRYNITSTNGGMEVPVANVTLGQQLLPFGLDPQSPEDLRPTINVAYGLGQLGLFSRQDGLILRGDFAPYVDYGQNYRAPLLQYALGINNGNGTNKPDDNNGKNVIGRLAFTLPVDYNSPFRELKFGASYIGGSKNVASGTNVLDRSGRNNRLGLDVYYNHAPFGVTYEYVQGKSDYATAANTVSTVKAEGQTFTAFYTVGDQFYDAIKTAAKFDDFWPKSIQTFYRYDTYNPNEGNDVVGISGHGQGKVTIQTLGLNFFFAQTTKFQLGINHWDYAHDTSTQKDYNELQAQFQYTF